MMPDTLWVQKVKGICACEKLKGVSINTINIYKQLRLFDSLRKLDIVLKCLSNSLVLKNSRFTCLHYG